jgi:hypothetical protein
MSQDEAWRQLAQECPRKIIGALHWHGHYVHVTSPHLPGKVLCFHRDSERPEGWEPTPAQQCVWANATPPAQQ